MLPAVNGHQIVVTGQLCWDLLDPDVLHTDQKLWEMVGQEFAGSDTVLDRSMPKPHAEFLVWGKACAPGGVPVAQMDVSVALGNLHKKLTVTGDRYWEPSLLRTKKTQPSPFVEMPVQFERAFGGAGFSLNPVGMGFDAKRRIDNGDRVQIPNIELPEHILLHQGDERTPAVLAPLNLDWPGTLDTAGTFDETWRKQRAPVLPLDFDYGVFNVAASDQRLGAGSFRGDEALRITGMHPDHGCIDSRLPNVALRVFAAHAGKDGLQEYPAALDTVWLFPSSLTGILLYRAVISCEDADARDIDALMFAAEHRDAPRPDDHYLEVYRLRSDEKTKALYLLADDQLMPELKPEQHRVLEVRRDEVRSQRRAKWQAKDAQFSAMAASMTGVALPVAAAGQENGEKGSMADLMPIVLPEDIARGNVDLAGIRRAADAMQERAADMRAAASRLLPPAMRAGMGFSEAEIAAGAKQSDQQSTELLGLQEANAGMAQQAQEFQAMVQRLEADPKRSVQQEIQDLMKKTEADMLAQTRPMIQDPKLLAFFDESLAVKEALSSSSSTPVMPEMPGLRAQLIDGLREMAAGFAQGMFKPPAIDPSDGPLLAVLGIDPASTDPDKWPPGKLGALLQKRLAAAAKEGGMSGVADLNAQLGLASLASLPPEMQARLRPQLEQQRDLAREHTQAYAAQFPEAAKKMADAFTQTPKLDQLPEMPDSFAEMHKAADLMPDTPLRERVKKLIDQGEELIQARDASLPTGAEGGAAFDFRQSAKDDLAEAAALASFTLPADDQLPEEDDLTYDKRYARAVAAGLISRLGLPLEPPAELAAAATSGAAAGGTFALLQSSEKMMRDGRQRSPMPMPQLGGLAPSVSAHLGDWVKDRHRRGISLAGCDLAGADLRNADLSGADLRGAFLERADLSGARLDGARCEGLVLSSATLTAASFRRADLRNANLSNMQAHQAVFTGADLSGANLFRADLSGADCSHAVFDRVTAIEARLDGVQADESRCRDAKFIKASLCGVSLQQALWHEVMFIQVEMAGLRAAGASLEKCVWAQSNLADCDFSGALLHRSQFNGCDARGLRAERLQATGFSWAAGNLDGACFAHATLKGALFESAPLAGADFRRANLAESILMRAQAVGACFDEAQLLRVRFHNADLSMASFRFANLHGADLSDARLDLADLSGARRLATLMEEPRARPLD